jgi:hypothetical protein
MKKSLLLLLLCLPILPARPAVAEDDLVGLAAVQSEKIARDLDELAAWCQENKLYLGRDNCYQLLIRFTPDHKDARKRLKYTRKDGEWVRGNYSPPENRNEEMEPIYLERIQKIVSTYVSNMLGILERTYTGRETPERMAALADLVHVDPSNAEIRDLMGEANRRGKWVLKETVSAEKRHADLLDTAKEAIAAVKSPKMIAPTDEEKDLGVRWISAFQGEWWRALGTVPAKEVDRCLRHMEASDDIFNAAFGLEFHCPAGCGFYLLNGKKQAGTVLEKHPAFGDAQRKYLLGLTAAWIPGKRIFFKWSDSEDMRLDGSVRNAVGIMMLMSFGISTKRGWVWEGLGLYLDEIITGSRRTVFVTRKIHTTTEKEAKFDIERRMKAPGANWLLIARDLYDAGAAPDLNVMSRKEVNDLTNEDLIVGYALSRYIVEGNPELATKFFLFHGETQGIYDTIDQVFKRPVGSFLERFRRWLQEYS